MNTNTTSRIAPSYAPHGGRHQIGTPAGFGSEQVAGFTLECMAGFVGIRAVYSWKREANFCSCNY
jgi:hypothetical protein